MLICVFLFVLLQATVASDPATYDAYSVFKVFSTFPEVKIKLSLKVQLHIQWDLSNPDTIGTPDFVLINEVSSF